MAFEDKPNAQSATEQQRPQLTEDELRRRLTIILGSRPNTPKTLVEAGGGKQMHIIPDREAFENVQQQYPDKHEAVKYRLAQADTLLRFLKNIDPDELHRMTEDGVLDDLLGQNDQESTSPEHC